MGYDMKKMDYEKWKTINKAIHYNKRKLWFHPLYNKKKFIIDLYKMMLNKTPNLDNPSTFSEKLNVMKLDKKMIKKYSQYADKDFVRNYVKEKVGKEILVPQYFSKSKITVSDLEKLPNSFVLKTNNGSGTNYIVMDKKKENLKEICDYLNYLSKIQYGYIWGEFFYNKIKPKIVAEKLLLDKENNIPDDLKCFCFKDNNNVKRKILYVERVIDDERYRIMFDENWKIIDYGCSFSKLNIDIKRPQNYKKILSVIDKLSEDFNFVRVDLYVMGNKIYFGELTFIPTAGYLQFDDDKIDLEWGNYIGSN